MTTDHRPAGSHLWTKACVLFLALIICALCAALTSGPAQATNTYGEYSYASFYEHTAPYGVTATWTDEEWSIPCPAETNHEDFVATYVNGYGSVANSWIQTGHGKITFWSGGVCYYQHQYYWEWNDPGHGYNTGVITSPSPPGTHKFALNRLSSGCQTGHDWCWHERIDGVDKHTCCFLSDFTTFPSVVFPAECFDDCVDTSCGSSGLVTGYNFQRKTSADQADTSWPSWSGRDGYCVYYDWGARGKWLSDTQASGGFNVTMTGSLNGCVP